MTTDPSAETTTETGGVTSETVATEVPTSSASQTTVTAASPSYYSPLTGEPVSSEVDLTKPVTAMMIDNLAPARPQSGIKDGEVIFEAIAEAGITRFLVLYQQNQPALIGPVRSLRIYDIDWAKAFDASIGHVGGAPSALTEVRNGRYRDIDMFLNGSYYWRSDDRRAPHNVYTSSEKVAALNKRKGYDVSHPAAFSRVDESPSAMPDATSISIRISSASYNSTFAYDKATNTYARSQGGKPFVDREAGQVTPKVVVALVAKEWQVTERSKIPTRERIGTIGSGQAVIFQNGTATEVTWHKTDQDAQLMFTDQAGEDVPLVRGQTWIIAVPNDASRISWN